MRTFAVAVAFLALSSCVLGQSMREQFQSAFQSQEEQLNQDVNQLASSVWDLLCTNDCTFTTPSQQQNSTMDPNIGFASTFTDATPYLNLIQSIGGVANTFLGDINDDVNDDDLFMNAMFAAIMTSDFKSLQEVYQNFYQDLLNSWQTQGNSMFNATLQGGSGFGFGVQVDCNSTTLFTIGGGAGTGFSGMYGNMQAGGGGGAGLQAYDTMGNLIMTTGGGGGGGLDMIGQAIWVPSWGTSTDPGQVIDHNLFNKLAPLAQACYQEGGLILRGAGGGGGGLYAGTPSNPSNDDFDDDSGPYQVMTFGVGWGFSFTHASPSGSGTATDPVTGSELGNAAKQCHNQCSTNPSTGTFYECFCPCLKQAFSAIPGQTWASHMVCYIPPPL